MKGTFLNSFCKASTILVSKPNRKKMERKKNIDHISDRYRYKNSWQTTNKLNSHQIKKVIYNDQVGFISAMQTNFSVHKSINVVHHINKMNKIIKCLNKCRKSFDKIQYSFIIKSPEKLGTKGILQ
jgi:hypothetical protein